MKRNSCLFILGLIVLLQNIVVACSHQEINPQYQAHYVDSFGNSLENFEVFYEQLFSLFGSQVPQKITVTFRCGENSYFDVENNVILIGKPTQEAVAHESCHLTLASVSSGISNTEAFRFMDEGFCNIFGKEVTGQDKEVYRKKALIMAAARYKKGTVSFSQVQKWSDYFNRRMDWTAYDVGASFVYFIREKYGQHSLMALFNEIGKTKDFNGAFQVVMKKDSAEVEKEWFNFLSAIPVDEKLLTQPKIVKLFPTNNSNSVDPAIKELEVLFDLDMNTNIICLVTKECDGGICYKNAYWKDARTLVIRLPRNLQPDTEYSLTIGHPYDKCALTSAYGDPLLPVGWQFKTGNAK